MTKLALHEQIMNQIRQDILSDTYPDGQLPDERTLSQTFAVSRSTIKKAIDALVEEGLVFKKRGSGTFINLLFKKNYADYSHQRKGPIGLTKSFASNNKVTAEILSYEVILPTTDIQNNLLIDASEFVYHIKRLRLINDIPISIETAYIPIKEMPKLTLEIATDSIYTYATETMHLNLTNSYISIHSAPSTDEDCKLLQLGKDEPVTIVEEIVFLDTGTPFEYTIIRNHYKKFTYNTIVKKTENRES